MNEGKRSAGRHELIKGNLKLYLLPYFGNKDIALIQRKDLITYRKWRQDFWITGPAKANATGKKVKVGTVELPNVSGALLMQGGSTSATISTTNVPTLLGLAALPIDPTNPVPLGSVDATPVEDGQPDVEVDEDNLAYTDDETAEDATLTLARKSEDAG